MTISDIQSTEPAWPTGRCIDVIFADKGSDPVYLDLRAKYMVNDTLTISEEAFEALYQKGLQERSANSLYPSWAQSFCLKPDISWMPFQTSGTPIPMFCV